jgi:starch phosphorylase
MTDCPGTGHNVRTSLAKQGAIDMETNRTIAYFSMEIALEAGMPTYSGGLGVLAGDTIRAAAELTIPVVAVTLLHRQGYFD